MTKNEMIETFAAKADISQTESKRLIEELFEMIAAHAIEGEEISLPELGILRRVPTEAWQGRNPRTGAVIEIAAGYRIGFYPSGPLLKRRLAELPAPSRAA